MVFRLWLSMCLAGLSSTNFITEIAVTVRILTAMTTSNDLEKEVCLQYDKDKQIQFHAIYLVNISLCMYRCFHQYLKFSFCGHGHTPLITFISCTSFCILCILYYIVHELALTLGNCFKQPICSTGKAAGQSKCCPFALLHLTGFERLVFT